MSGAKMTNGERRDFAALFAEAAHSEDFDFELKAQEVAVNLSALMLHAGQTRADLARSLGWKPARVTKVLGGEENLTLRTLHAIYKALGYTFDVVPRAEGQRAPIQPWQRFSFGTARIVTTDIKLEETPIVGAAATRVDESWSKWASNGPTDSYKLDFSAANTDQYNAALAS